MPSANVRWGTPLTRLNPWYPGQFGVPGTDSETGLRLDSNGTVFYVGYRTENRAREADADELQKINGIGPATASRIRGE